MKLFVYLILLTGVMAQNCPSVSLQTDPLVNISEYIRKSWYVQKQQLNGYQSLEELYCVTATYNIDNHSHVPFFSGRVLSVYNYANLNKVNGLSSNNSTVLCARETNTSSPEKLIVSPCFLPNILAGPYWIMAVGPNPENYEWSIVIGGQPSVRTSNTTCTTKTVGVKGSGLWLLTRSRVLNETTIDNMYKIMYEKGISKNFLKNVSQIGCKYNGAFIK